MKYFYLKMIVLSCFLSTDFFSQCTTPSNTPYYEGFNITTPNQLPLCWTASNPSVTCLTFTTGSFSGNGCAGFYYLPAGTSYFYSQAIQLFAGVTYSTGIWHSLSSVVSSSNPWTSLSIKIGNAPSNTGLVSIASVANPTNVNFVSLTNTFVVATSGIYYMAIEGVSNGNSGPQILRFDDFMITVPCTPSLNTPILNVSLSSSTVCNGSFITGTVSGADTYNFSSGTTSSTFTFAPTNSTTFTVVGTKTLTGCISTTVVAVQVVPSPPIFIVPVATSVCRGNSTTLTASGAASYTWSTGQQTTSINVTPVNTATYYVIGTTSLGCVSAASIAIGVNPLPILSVQSSALSSNVCQGETILFTGQGQSINSYTWNLNGSAVPGPTLQVTASVTSTIVLNGKDSNGCESFAKYFLTVSSCTGIDEKEGNAFLKIYPNPGNGLFLLNLEGSYPKLIEISDLLGKVIFSREVVGNQLEFDLSLFTNGVYYLKASSAGLSDYKKIIKN